MLDVSGNRSLASSLMMIGEQCVRLRVLKLCRTLVTPEHITQIASSCHELRTLKVSECSHFSDLCVAAVGSCLSNLTRLDISRCYLISDVSRLANCLALQSLVMRDCSYVETAGLLALSVLPWLSVLDVVGCRGVTDQLITSFQEVQLWPSLHVLRIGQGTKISDGAVMEFLDLNQPRHIQLMASTGIVNPSEFYAQIRSTSSRENRAGTVLLSSKGMSGGHGGHNSPASTPTSTTCVLHPRFPVHLLIAVLMMSRMLVATALS